MVVEYIPYPNNEFKKRSVFQDRMVSVFEFYNTHADSRLHPDPVRWSYLDRKSGYGLDTCCSVINEEIMPVPNKASLFSSEEFDYFSGMGVNLVFFKSLKSELKKPILMDRLLYHEMWHMIEQKNGVLYRDRLHEAAAELASWMCVSKDWKNAIDRTMDMYVEDELFNKTENEKESVLKGQNFWYISSLGILSKYCGTLSEILDEDKRAEASKSQDSALFHYINRNKDDIELIADIFSFLTEKQMKEAKQKCLDLEKKLH